MESLNWILLIIVGHTILRLATCADTPLLLIESKSSAPSLQEFTYHLVALPHTVVSPDFSPCAYTMKVWRMCTMLRDLNLNHVLYANEGSETDCTSFEQIFTHEERQAYYGSDADWRAGGHFNFDNEEAKREYVNRVVKAIAKHRTDYDIMLATFGYMHNSIADRTGLVGIETGIGYNGSWARFRVYESYAWLTAMTHMEDINYYYAVIPNCYYAHEFEDATPSVQGKYIAYVGRIVQRKGILEVLEILKNLPNEYTLHVAGQGNIHDYTGGNAELEARIVYHGVLTPAQRNNLIVGAQALVAPTSYKEPFGGVMVEAQFLGVPVITTDHACMAETIWHGVTGFRCRTLRCFVAAVHAASTLDRTRIWARAIQTYSCNGVMYQYEDYFRDVADMWDKRGWALLDAGSGHLLDQKQFYPSAYE